ncbi:MAG: tetratricopeptide repeat protein [Planctomycetia bacterium]|nr:tetratricopeptide repeat protein [Planctomycetia bacterium]
MVPLLLREKIFRQIAISLLGTLLACSSGCQFWRRTGVSSASTLASRQYVQEAVDSLQANHRSDAFTRLELAVKANPENYEARVLLADLLWESGSHEDAILQMQRATQNKDATAEMFVKLAWMYYETEEYGLAQKNLQRGLKRNASLADGWVLQGKLYEHDGKLPQAIAAFHQAVFYNPEESRAPLCLSDCYLKNQQPQRALETILAAKSKCPAGQETAEMLYREGLAMSQLKRYDEAARVLALAATKSDDPKIRESLAGLQKQTNPAVSADVTPQYGSQVTP